MQRRRLSIVQPPGGPCECHRSSGHRPRPHGTKQPAQGPGPPACGQIAFQRQQPPPPGPRAGGCSALQRDGARGGVGAMDGSGEAEGRAGPCPLLTHSPSLALGDEAENAAWWEQPANEFTG